MVFSPFCFYSFDTYVNEITKHARIVCKVRVDRLRFRLGKKISE